MYITHSHFTYHPEGTDKEIVAHSTCSACHSMHACTYTRTQIYITYLHTKHYNKDVLDIFNLHVMYYRKSTANERVACGGNGAGQSSEGVSKVFRGEYYTKR